MLAMILLPGGFAAADDWEDQSGWDEMEDNKTKEGEHRSMMLGAGGLPAGDFGLRLSTGLLYANAGVHVGILDRLDLIAESLFPYETLGDIWMVGGGLKVNIHGRTGLFQSAIKLKAYGIIYGDEAGAQNMSEGLALWPSFMIGLNVKEGCIYAELGAMLYPYTTSSSLQKDVFGGLPAHFGGEIYINDWFHMFINVDLLLASPVSFFTYGLSGPFNYIEVGALFII
ncbi:MAG: hypothetical protein JRF33_25915 [Deltaproteobacteria bacterium]|nr:hypothetical protein [Deltaproteobacteria bacterium]